MFMDTTRDESAAAETQIWPHFYTLIIEHICSITVYCLQLMAMISSIDVLQKNKTLADNARFLFCTETGLNRAIMLISTKTL